MKLLLKNNDGFVSISAFFLLSYITGVFFWYMSRVLMVIEVRNSIIGLYEKEIIQILTR
ncbi:hypothetical protein GCM10007358_03270 [Phocicoccus schoeneichii]|uniref:Uncharacterized protein n=1 Tax=Phocicoccus schoeneichii TaxID=1812261 RepID=A0A6V7RIP1_9BACL|nr:hypothetical protein GCM10007358_03270 [Jeotgalicoccus schoeneichii]CAD2077107.1 hypothetical protein JEOSCH030_01224 [Jeotgalicoccus schoeneichii]